MMSAGFLALIVLASVLNLEVAPKPATAGGTPPGEPAATTSDAPAKEAAVTALAGGVDSLKSQVETLTKLVKELQKHLVDTPKVDLGPLQSKIDALAKANQSLAGLPQQIDSLDSRLGKATSRVADIDKAVQTGMGSLRQELDSLKGEVKRVGQAAQATAKPADTKPATGSTPASTTPAAEPAVVADEARTLTQLASLYKAGKFKEAAEAFRTDEETNPKDARAWYYAALSYGSSTNQWKGEAERLVKRGVDREKAGTPKVSEIDTEFASIPAAIKAWLDYYRKGGS